MEFRQLNKDPDVYVTEVPFAHFGLAATNCYLVCDGDDAVLIDPGAQSPLVERGIARAMRAVDVDPDNVRFLCTHLHFDHVANLKTMVRPGSNVLMSTEAFKTNPYSFYELRGALLRSVQLEEGLSRSTMRGIAAVMQEARVCDLKGCDYTLLEDGQDIHIGPHTIRVITTPGHDRGHICFFSPDAGLLFAGDHILEKITPGLSLPFEGDDSLGDYLTSLSKVEMLECHLVLPGHGQPFSGLSVRCAELRHRHVERLGQTYEVIAHNPGCNGNTIMRAMPWKESGPYRDWMRLNPYLRMSISAQTFSYLEYLVNIGEIVREEDKQGRHYRIR